MANIVSACCQASIETGRMTEYPLGGRTYGITYKVDVCSACGEETDAVEACEYCGEALDEDNAIVIVRNYECCLKCMEEVIELSA